MRAGPILLDARTATPHFPGIGRYVTGLARALPATVGARPVVLIHGHRPDARLPLDRLSGVACRATPFTLSQQWIVRQTIRGQAAALYHSPYYLMPFSPGTATVVTCYDLIPLTVPGLFDRARRLVYRLANALAFRAASAIIVPSSATARDVARLFPSHAVKLHVIPPGHDLPLAAAASGTGRPKGPYVLSVGSNKPHKNLRVLVEAWAAVVSGGGGAAGARLVLAGPRDPRYDEGGATADALRRDGRLVSLGAVSDAVLADLYRGAELFVLPSRAEGFGLPALEGMALGAPVACSRIGALTELCGDGAAFFEPGAVEPLAALIAHLLEAPAERDRLREAGRRRAAAFTWDAVVPPTLSIYERAIREGR